MDQEEQNNKPMSIFTIPSLRTGDNLSVSAAKRSKDNDGFQHELGAYDEDDEDHHSILPSQQDQKPGRAKPGRKMVNSEPQDKKVAQQRAASRAFRERKANYIKELEQKVADLSAQLASAGSGPLPQQPQPLPPPQNPDPILAQRVATLEAENTLLRQMTFSFDFKVLNNYVSPPPVLPDLSGLLAANASLNALAAAGTTPDQMQQMQIQMQMQMQAALLAQLQAAQQAPLQQQEQQIPPPAHPLLATSISPAVSINDSFSALLQPSSTSPDPSSFVANPSTSSPSTSTNTSFFKASPVASPAAGALIQPSNAVANTGNLDFASLLDFSSYREASATPPFDATGGSLYDEGGTEGRDSADLFDELIKMEQTQLLPQHVGSGAGVGAQEAVTKEVVKCTNIVKEELKAVPSLSPEDVDELCGEFQKCSTNAQKEGVTINLCPDHNPDHQHLMKVQQKIIDKVQDAADKHKVQSILATAAGKMREKVELAALGFDITNLD